MQQDSGSLPKAFLGRTKFETTRLGFGAMELAGFEPGGARIDAERLLHAVLDLGINLIDTAPDYGRSEELIGAHLAKRRGEFFLASKCGCLVDREPKLANGKLEHDFSAANIRKGVEQSLKRMRTDHLDLVQVHSSPSRAVLERHGSVEAMLRLRDEGKIRFLGMSSTLPELDDHIAMGVFDVFQIPYSALQREHEAVISRAAAAGAGTIIRGGVARGAPAPDHDVEQKAAFWRPFSEQRRDLWERARLDELLGGASRMEFLLRFALGHRDLHTTIVGTAKLAHLEANVAAAAKGPLPEDLRAEAVRRLERAA
jgi:aryl-alcohol dehydrogenase-like predicted oxidoreductase